MSKTSKFSSFIIIFLLAAVSVQAQKFGYINTATILADMPEVKQAEANLKSFQEQLQKRGQGMVTAFQEKVRVVQEKADKGELSPVQQETEAKKLDEERQKVLAFEQDMVQQIQKKRQDVLQPIYDRLNKAIADVAKENGYQMIFDKAVLLYSEDKDDVSNLVKSKLGM